MRKIRKNAPRSDAWLGWDSFQGTKSALLQKLSLIGGQALQTLCWILPQDLFLAFIETKHSLCARMCELGVLHYTSLGWCIPRQQLG